MLNVLAGLAAAEDRRTVDVVGALVQEQAPTFMGVKGPPGFSGTKVFLNDQLARTAKQRSGDRLRDALVDDTCSPWRSPSCRLLPLGPEPMLPCSGQLSTVRPFAQA